MKLSLSYNWECSPDAFWALYFDPAFVVRLHLEGLGSFIGLDQSPGQVQQGEGDA